MMKRFFLAACLLVASLIVAAQQPDIESHLKAHPELLAGTDYLCPTGPAALTKAPKGYKVFYISHYGRHGARYAWQSDIYDWMNSTLAEAAESGNLTEYGQDYKRRFDILYPEVRYRVGDLSRKGWKQQEKLAERMYKNFPKVFPDGAEVRAWTSTSTRCVMTMSAFCQGLKGMNPKIDLQRKPVPGQELRADAGEGPRDLASVHRPHRGHQGHPRPRLQTSRQRR